MPYLLEAEHTIERHKNHLALDDVSVRVQPNSVFRLLGPNGAGKNALIKIVNKILLAGSRTVLLNDKEMIHRDIRHIGCLPEERRLYKKMRVGGQVIYLARLRGLSRQGAQQELKCWFKKFDIMPWWHHRVEELSKGMRQKVRFICTVIHRPKLPIFNELFSGFGLVNAELPERGILELQDNGCAVIFSARNIQSVGEVYGDIALINQSKVVPRGNVTEVKRSHFEGIASLLIAGEGYRPNWVGSLTEQQIELFGIKRKGHNMRVRFRDPQRCDVRALTELVPTDLHLLEVAREIPSMQDIFIRITTVQAQPATATP